MKISKSLLQAIVVGVTLGTTSTSCGLVDQIEKTDLPKQDTQEQVEPTDRTSTDNQGTNEQKNGGETTPPTCGDCPACGMG
ncbi:MAG: hypothetical protein GC192_02355 [Bacteroidetes bacterium]|nr:hypothetical protein [Bacteroidota bacterium]